MSPIPDRSACMCVGRSFSSPSAITSFIVTLLKNASVVEMSTQDLLLIVESTGSQSPYQNRLNLRRQVLRSLTVFQQINSVREQRSMPSTDLDPFGDVFLGFQHKLRAHLECIMDHHGLPLNDRSKMSLDSMRTAIVDHIFDGHCLSGQANSRTAFSRSLQKVIRDQDSNKNQTSCEDFVRSLSMPCNASNIETCIRLLTEAVHKISSRKVLHRILNNAGLQYANSENLKELRIRLRRHIKKLDKSSGQSSVQQHLASRQTVHDWPSVPSQTLKDKIMRCFREETSSIELQSCICASCSSSVILKDCITVVKNTLDLSCLAHPETRLSGMPVNLCNMTATNLHAGQLAEGILLDQRGVVNDGTDIRLCKACYGSIEKGKTPPLSLANHLLLGDIPIELQELTPIKESLIARCRAKLCVIQLNAEQSISLPNTQRGLRGHIIIYPQKPDNLMQTLPPSLEQACQPICVVFIGSKRPSQEWLRHKAKPLIVRRTQIRNALLWLKSHNPLYRHVHIDDDMLQQYPEEDILPIDIHVVDDCRTIDSLTSAYDNVHGQDTDSLENDEHSTVDMFFDSIVVSGVETDASANQLRAAALHHMKVKGGGFLQIPHADRPVNEFYSPDLLPMTYPTLFPYGVGGFEDLRRISPLSFKQQVKHFFSLADPRFQTHYSFLFTVFNILQCRAILLHTSLKTKKTSFDHFAEEFNGISSDTIRHMCERLSNTDKNNTSANTVEERRVLQLMKEVNVINHHVPGSSAARVMMRNEIRALIMEKGLPSFYITINPADVYNPLVKFLAGHDIDVDHLLPEQVPDYMQQSILVAKNPFIAARFFNIYLKAFFKCILGYDETSLETNEGLLGTVSAYYGCVEAQGRGSLHCHMIVWLKGALNCDEIRDRVLAGDLKFQEQMITYLDDCISNEIPFSGSEDITVQSDNSHPCSIRGVYNLTDTAARQKDLSNVVKRCQSHQHSATCYKYWKGPSEQPKECRFGLGPDRFREKTNFDENTGELHMRCLDGLVNNFNATIIETMRCNMDIQFMGSGPSTKAVIYYITDYITKSQLKAHVAYAALELAVKKLNEVSHDDDPKTIKAKRLLQKCAYSMISKQELSSQQVASYLIDLEDHFTSLCFQKLYWTSFEHFVNHFYSLEDQNQSTDENPPEADTESSATTENESQLQTNDHSQMALQPTDAETDFEHGEAICYDNEIIINTSNDGELKVVTPQLEDYLLRGPGLNSLSVWEYTSLIEKVPIKPKNPKTQCDGQRPQATVLDAFMINDESHRRPKFDFHPSYSDYETHIQQLKHPKHRPITTPIGPSMPRRDRTCDQQKYARLMLILLKPWTNPTDLMDGFPNFHAAFETFVTANPRWHALLNNMQLLHECRDSRDDHFEERSRLRYKASRCSETSAHHDYDHFESNDTETINTKLMEHLTSIDNSRSLHLTRSDDNVNLCLQETRTQGLFACRNTSEYETDVTDDPSDDNTFMHEQEWRHEYERRRQAYKNIAINEQEHMSDHNLTSHDTSGTTSISHLSSSITTDITMNDIDPPQNLQKSQQTNLEHISAIESQFTLNEEQQRAFRIITEHSLLERPEQLLLYIAGPGGTGKSRVLDAVREFFHVQQQDTRLRITAYTGVAANNVRGMTLHSALSLSQRNKRSSKGKKELIAMWQNVNYLVIDEVSMIGCKLLLSIHEALCEAKENIKPFGGIDIIFAGDFAQLPPIGDTRLYSHINSRKAATNSGQKEVFGKLLWLSVNKVVLLHQLLRQNSASDSRFIDLLARLRTGSCTDEDYIFLSSKQLRHTYTNLYEPIWSSAPILVSNNDVKDAINLEAAKAFAARTNQPLHYYYANDKRQGKIITDGKLKEKLLSYHSGKTEQRLGILPLCKGMPVMLTHNYVVSDGIVNGCIGRLEKINYTTDNNGRRHAHSCIIQTESVTDNALPHLSSHQIVALEEETSLTFTHPHSNKTCRFQRTQLPIVPAFALTGHKSQGKTIPSAIVDLESCLSTEAVYVMLSRVKTSENLRILWPFSKTKISTRLSEDLRKEFKRLEYLNDQTRNPSNESTSLSINPSLGGARELDRVSKWFEHATNRDNDETMSDL